jgi:hypothetical protein
VVRIRNVQIHVDGVEELALPDYWISDGINWCHIGFLQCHLVKHWKEYDGRIAQEVVNFYKDSECETKQKKNHKNLGCCQAVLIDTVHKIKTERDDRRKWCKTQWDLSTFEEAT